MKSKNLPTNPFSITTYLGSDYFCDRKKETEELLRNIKNDSSTTLIAIRRIGKTGLIKHTFGKLPKIYKSVYIDILETENLNHFLNLLASSILKSVPERSNIGKKIWDFIKTLRPTISFDALSGDPKVSFDARNKEIEINIDSLLHFLETQNFKTVIAIDEFQQITNYPEKNVASWLRSRIQQLKNIIFIFSGSQQHLMTELFSSPKQPFYRSTQIMKLEKIDKTIYKKFIVEQFKKYKKDISSEIALEILSWTNTHTFYVQQVCNRVFSATNNNVTSDIWKLQAKSLLKEQELLFFSYRNMLTQNQWQLLKAIANENIVYQPTSREFLKNYGLGSSASVLRSLSALINNEIVYSDFDKDGKKYYSVYDILLQRRIDAK
jgi:uncharacterized protein